MVQDIDYNGLRQRQQLLLLSRFVLSFVRYGNVQGDSSTVWQTCGVALYRKETPYGLKSAFNIFNIFNTRGMRQYSLSVEISVKCDLTIATQALGMVNTIDRGRQTGALYMQVLKSKSNINLSVIVQF